MTLTDRDGNQQEVYICGNPPFLGHAGRNKQQNEDMMTVFSGFNSAGNLDFVACWFWKGAQYASRNRAKAAFVATNSLAQGEQVSILWPSIFGLGVGINFAYQTFSWRNHAKQNAAVHVVIIGLAKNNTISSRSLFRSTVDTLHRTEPQNINPYLLEGRSTVVMSRRRPLQDVPEMVFGSMPNDGGHLLLSSEERDQILEEAPDAHCYIRKLLGAQEFIQSKERWCLWLDGVDESVIASYSPIQKRVKMVEASRLASKRKATRSLAVFPHLFGEIRQPKDGQYILVPCHSSERRPYLPIGYLPSDVIASNANLMIPNATLYEFGILTSEMHNDWMRAVAGRLESRYRYSATLVYNTFPWPEVSEAKRKHIEALAEEIILIREDYPDKTLADLYDPDKMPAPLLEAHKTLDRAVEALYRDRPFRDASERLEHLFGRYEKLIAAEKAKASAKKTKKG